jgi:uncharacterized membrane-anchored protein
MIASMVLAGCVARAQASDPMFGLHRLTGMQTLPRSHATFVVPHGSALFVGNDAKIANDRLMDGSTGAEAVLQDGERTSYITYVDSGFIPSNDWSRFSPQKLLFEIREATNAQNSARSRAGLPTYTVGRWIEPPQFEIRRAIATCIYEISDSRGVHGNNAVALILGRRGYELFSMFRIDADVNIDREAFEHDLVGFSFPSGGRYADHLSTDRRAPFDLPTAFRGETGGAP